MMNRSEQLRKLDALDGVSRFDEKLKESARFPLTSGRIEIMQINVGPLCNLQCTHCHVEAGPHRKEVMALPIFEKCLDILSASDIETVDITGGAPELNPHMEWFLNQVSALKRHLIVRSNLAVLSKSPYSRFIDIYAHTNTEIIGSLPCYTKKLTETQRGQGVFDQIIQAMKRLNQVGYGQEESSLRLHLVHNPVGTSLPGPQAGLEKDYKRVLEEKYQVKFNSLYTITNMPIGRYLDTLIKDGKLDLYMETLANAYNPCAADRVMCRSTISIGYDGTLYDCDFNQMLNMPVNHGAPDHIDRFHQESLDCRQIVTANHCFGCTAGSGSSCQGATLPD